ncbi:MAG: hypothetical protein FD180_1213 [Planctomycetota bacterium]|nr:MAG: hypothetical protein FD180_1213 [Planctomycetota bacterium]
MRGIACTVLSFALFAACYAGDPAPAADPLTVRMETERISFDFKDAGLNGVVEWLTTETGLKIRVSEAARQRALDKKLKITARLKDVKLAAALRLLFENHGMVMLVEDGWVRLRLRDEAAGTKVTRRIDVRELLATVPDFEGPDVGLPEDSGCPSFG